MESYLPIPGHPGYEVSDLGNVRNARTGRVMKLLTVRGYQSVTLFTNKQRLPQRVNRLVLRTHVGPPPTAYHHGAHGDGDKSNNTLGNLRWATPKENCADRERHGRTARGARPGAHTKPERTLRGDQHPAHPHPERMARGERSGRHTKPERTARGERNGKTTITEADVRAIRTDPRSLRKLAAHYRLTYGTVGKIRRRETWAHVL